MSAHKSILILLSIVFTAFTLVAQTAGATQSKSGLSSFQRVISYDELMRLSPARRATYIRGLRSLFKNLEAAKAKSKSSSGSTAWNESSSLIQQHRLIGNLLQIYDQWIAVAEAAEPPRPVGMPYQENGTVSCVGNYRALKVYGASGDVRTSNYVCVTNQMGSRTTTDLYSRGCPADMKEISRDAQGPRCTKTDSVLKRQTTACGAGLVAVSQDASGGYFCATEKSFARVPAYGQRNVRITKYYPMFSRPGFLARVMGPGLGRYFQETGPSVASIDSKIKQSGASAFDQKPMKQYGLWESPTEYCPVLTANGETKDVAPPEYAASVRARCAAYAQFGDTKPLPPLVRVVPKVVVKSEAPKPTKRFAVKPPLAKPTAKASGKTTVKPSVLKTPSTKLAVWQTQEGLASGEQTATRNEVSLPQPTTSISIVPTEDQIVLPEGLRACAPDSNDGPTCEPGKVEEARRKYVSDSNPDCIYAGSVVGYESGAKRSFKCEPPRSFCFGSPNCKSQSNETLKPDFTCGSKAVICNPLLFGVKSDGKTPFCVDRDANATLSCESATEGEEGIVQPLDQDHAGIREAWNDFADRVFQLCHANATAKTLHCAECDVIKKRLFALNVAVRDVKTCGAAVKFEAANCTEDGKCSGRPGITPSIKITPAGSVSQTLPNANEQSLDQKERKPAGSPEPAPSP